METILGDPGTIEGKIKTGGKKFDEFLLTFLRQIFFRIFFSLRDHSQEEVKVFSERRNFGKKFGKINIFLV